MGNCYSMNLTARLIRPTVPPTTPPIPEHLIPFFKTAYNVTAHLKEVAENLKNGSEHAARAREFLNQNLSNWWNATTTTHQPLSSGEWTTLERLTGQLLPYENFLQLALRRWFSF